MSGMSLRRVGAWVKFWYFTQSICPTQHQATLWSRLHSSKVMLWKVPPAASRSYSSPDHGHELGSARKLRRWPSCAFSILLTAFNQPSSHISPPPRWSLNFTHASGRHKTITAVAADILH
jgi:hypothetical protein